MTDETAPQELHDDNRGQWKPRKISFLTLDRQVGESFYIGDHVRVTVIRMNGNHVDFGFDAPRSVQIDRQEKAWLRRRSALRAQAFEAETITYRLSYFARGGTYVCGGKRYPTKVAVRSAALACAAERAERGMSAFDSYTAFREIEGRWIAVAVYALADDSLLLEKAKGYSRMPPVSTAASRTP